VTQQQAGGIVLGVAADLADLSALKAERCRDVGCGGGLADAALAVKCDFFHNASAIIKNLSQFISVLTIIAQPRSNFEGGRLDCQVNFSLYGYGGKHRAATEVEKKLQSLG
jgi:hypothetical protein